MEYQRENDLLKQQIDFLNRKLQEQILFNEENDKSHEDNINELKMELEETFTNKINEIINDKKDLYDKLKEAENTIKNLNNKYNELSMQYENIIDQEKTNSQNVFEDYESQIKKINYEMEKSQKKSFDQTVRINKLLEEKSALQNELYKYRDLFQQQMKEKEESEEIIKNLEKEKNDLIQDKENLIKDMNRIDSRIKSKGPKTSDISNKFQNIGQSSMSMIRTNMGLESGRKKNQSSNISLNSGNKEDKNENSKIKNTNWESARKTNNNFGIDSETKDIGNKNNISNTERKDKGKKISRINNNNNK